LSFLGVVKAFTFFFVTDLEPPVGCDVLFVGFYVLFVGCDVLFVGCDVLTSVGCDVLSSG
jgi:hypothetical protein